MLGALVHCIAQRKREESALERKQFGTEIFNFPRVANKLVMMAAEIMASRQIAYFAARQKDSGKRCDLGLRVGRGACVES